MDHTGDIIILGIESSCDDTAAAILYNGKILANIAAGQDVHEKYGGVVPELASRAHQKHIVPVVAEAMKEAGIENKDLTAIAYTKGPGLLGSLLVGSAFAKSMAQSLGIPALPVHHMKAHVLAHLINTDLPKPDFPFLCLTVSGGHTQILKVTSPYDFEILGETLDDAAGEAFDKAAKYMELPYPGGPVIDRLAKDGDPWVYSFTKPKVPGLNFSFSGLKTNFVNFIHKNRQRNPDFVNENQNNLAASIQHTILEMLMENLIKASEETGIKRIALAGGVSANSELRTRIKAQETERDWQSYIPPFEFCTDNGAMIAIAGYYDFLENKEGKLSDAAVARWRM